MYVEIYKYTFTVSRKTASGDFQIGVCFFVVAKYRQVIGFKSIQNV